MAAQDAMMAACAWSTVGEIRQTGSQKRDRAGLRRTAETATASAAPCTQLSVKKASKCNSARVRGIRRVCAIGPAATQTLPPRVPDEMARQKTATFPASSRAPSAPTNWCPPERAASHAPPAVRHPPPPLRQRGHPPPPPGAKTQNPARIPPETQCPT